MSTINIIATFLTQMYLQSTDYPHVFDFSLKEDRYLTIHKTPKRMLFLHIFVIKCIKIQKWSLTGECGWINYSLKYLSGLRVKKIYDPVLEILLWKYFQRFSWFHFISHKRKSFCWKVYYSIFILNKFMNINCVPIRGTHTLFYFWLNNWNMTPISFM